MSSGDGMESPMQESSKSASIIIPEDFESQKEMVRTIPPNVLLETVWSVQDDYSTFIPVLHQCKSFI